MIIKILRQSITLVLPRNDLEVDQAPCQVKFICIALYEVIML